MELDDLGRERGEAADRASARPLAAIGLREEEHVIDETREAVQILEIRSQHVSQLGNAALAAQGKFGLADQGRQRSAKFVSDVRIEPFQLLIRVVQANEERIELCDQGLQFLRLRRAIQRLTDVFRTERRGLSSEVANGQQRASHEPRAPRGDDHRAGQRTRQ